MIFNEMAAYHVANSRRANGKQHPPKTAFAKVNHRKYQHKQVKRHP